MNYYQTASFSPAGAPGLRRCRSRQRPPQGDGVPLLKRTLVMGKCESGFFMASLPFHFPAETI